MPYTSTAMSKTIRNWNIRITKFYEQNQLLYCLTESKAVHIGEQKKYLILNYLHNRQWKMGKKFVKLTLMQWKSFKCWFLFLVKATKSIEWQGLIVSWLSCVHSQFQFCNILIEAIFVQLLVVCRQSKFNELVCRSF